VNVKLPARVLRGTIAAAQRAVGTRNIAILESVLMQAEGDRLHIIGTDLNCSIDAACPATVTTAGIALIPAARLSGILGAADGEREVTIAATSDRAVTVRTGPKTLYRVATQRVGGFPEMPPPGQDAAEFLLSAEGLETVLAPRAVVSEHEHRHYLHGVFLTESSSGQLLGVATDGTALLTKTCAVTGADRLPVHDERGTRGVIIPIAAVLHLLWLARKGDDMTWRIDRAKLQVRAGDIVYTTKLIDGTFPDYRRVIPPSSATGATFDVEEMRDALRRLMAASTSERPQVVFSWSGDGEIRLIDEMSAVDDTIAADTAGAATVTTPAAQTIKLLTALGASRVRMSVPPEGNPLRFDGDDGAIAVQTTSRGRQARAAA
jgi:DNA polymerase III subunit beta